MKEPVIPVSDLTGVSYFRIIGELANKMHNEALK